MNYWLNFEDIMKGYDIFENRKDRVIKYRYENKIILKQQIKKIYT